MVYAYDQWAPMPVKDLYDTQIMALAINVAKDMYDKGEQAIKDFRKEYGDFYSPTQSHMDYYNQNFNVSGLLDDLYKQGIDPLRSKEGRALVQQYINTRPYQTLERMKKSAETYDTYLKNMADLQKQNKFNQAFEDYILNGKTINDLGVDESWDRYSPSEYMDLNKYTNHIFDKMEDQFIGSDDQGRDWYGVTRDRRAEALTPKLGGLLSNDLGKFHYENARADAARLLGRTPTEDEVMQQFKENILTSTEEFDHRNWKENPEYKRKRDFYYDDLKDSRAKARSLNNQLRLRANTPGYDANGNPTTDNTSDDGVSMHEWSYSVAVANAMGSGYDPHTIGNKYDTVDKNINRIQSEFGKAAGTNKQAFIDRFTTTDGLHVEDIKQWHGGQLTDTGFRANLEDIRKIKSVDDVITGTRGYRGNATHTSSSLQDDVAKALALDHYVEIVPYGETYGAQTKGNYFAVDTKAKMRIYDNADGSGSFVEKEIYYNMDQDSEAAPTVEETAYDYFPGVAGFNNFTSYGRIMNSGFDRTLRGRLLNAAGDLPANTRPKQHNIGGDTKATADRYKSGQSTKLATSYK